MIIEVKHIAIQKSRDVIGIRQAKVNTQFFLYPTI